MAEQRAGTQKLILFGVAVAVPLAAVALYFAFFDQPPPRPPQPPVASTAPEAQTGQGQATLPPNHPPIGAQPGGAQPGSPQAPAGGQPGSAQPGGSPVMPPGHPQTPSTGRSVRVPEEVKGKWQAVKLRVEEKGGGKPPQIFTVKLGAQLAIPGSKLRVQVGEFLPALQVTGGEITSASNDPTNPAVMVTVSEGNKETFKGWLFGKFPDMQPFEHPTYRITLVEGVPAG